MTYLKLLRSIADVHAGAVEFCHHYFRPQMTPPYVLWQESGMDVFCADNCPAEYTIRGTTDYFTKQEFDPVIEKLMDAFTDAGWIWTLESVQFEPETNLIHYEWSWEAS